LSAASPGHAGAPAEGAPAISFHRVDFLDPRAVALREAMEAEMDALYADVVAAMPPSMLASTAGALDVHPESFVATVLGLDAEAAVAHAALRPVGDELEVKRVFVAPSHRGRGISRALMLALEPIALEYGARALILQTGTLQAASIGLYRAVGYEDIPPFGRYAELPMSVCFRKRL
jgi:GNAT superfamily N-acetyltransferase